MLEVLKVVEHNILSTLSHLSTLADANEDLHVHVDQANEGEHTSGEGWVPDKREGVPKYEGWVTSSFTRINLIDTIMLGDSDLQEFWHIQSKG